MAKEAKEQQLEKLMVMCLSYLEEAEGRRRTSRGPTQEALKLIERYTERRHRLRGPDPPLSPERLAELGNAALERFSRMPSWVKELLTESGADYAVGE